MINREWHEKNRMPAKATMEQRAKWHVAHAKVCGCREMPKTLFAYSGRGKTIVG